MLQKYCPLPKVHFQDHKITLEMSGVSYDEGLNTLLAHPLINAQLKRDGPWLRNEFLINRFGNGLAL